jgi:hypothetical protein
MVRRQQIYLIEWRPGFHKDGFSRRLAGWKPG